MALVEAFKQQGLNTEKIIARQSSGGQLHVFSGNPLDWPIFIHHYRQSTKDCGYFPAQNMARLEKAVQGELPDALRLQWGEYVLMREGTGEVILEDLSKWMNMKVAAASMVTMPDFKNSRDKENKHHSVMAAVESGSTKKCAACDEAGHYIGNCQPFKSSDVDDRWKIAQLSIDEGSQYPRADEALRKETYVDDIVTGAEDSESVMLLRKELICLLQKEGFVLKKWASNDPTILNQIPEDARHKKIRRDENARFMLGSGGVWITFCTASRSLHKGRKLQSMACYRWWQNCTIPWDGWRPFIQPLWITGKDWDVPIDGPIKEQWKKFREQLGCLRTVRMPCWLGLMGIQDIQLLGFSDASENAYASAVYIRISGSDGSRAELVAAKARLAPVRRISIPRLELCATVLLTCLITHILTVTIARTLPTFVGNRVSVIQTCRQIQEWLHVPSGENPADLASRGVLGSMIGSSRLWWKGPGWLILSRDQWPKMPTIHGVPKISTALSVGLVDQVPLLVALGERISSITTYNRVVAWMLRFISNCRGGKVQSSLNPAEIKRAHIEILLAVQQHYFGEELKSLSRYKGLGVHQPWIKILWCNWQGRSEFTSHEKLSRAETVLQRGRSILQESKRWVLIFLEDQHSNFHTCFCHPIALRESRT
ncbi:hypothetical protein LAZ67_18000919 [Cordylochernes scorpioides]|uniref:Reverse transcriptase n=1 Tax=Cordylochernes scorpioides TaxID=51811 RepID=A0ABY6LFM1_9ARAC|nr:hypothetical protein LAZ67_18000919 [Cordylochernes scorpioides]